MLFASLKSLLETGGRWLQPAAAGRNLTGWACRSGKPATVS
jgi:hypothetical protein